MSLPSGILWTPGDDSPPTPPPGKYLIFQKTDGSLWYKKPDGTEEPFIQTVQYPAITHLFTNSSLSFQTSPQIYIPWHGVFYETDGSPIRWNNNRPEVELTRPGVYRLSYKVCIVNYEYNRIALRACVANGNNDPIRGTFSFAYSRHRNYVPHASAVMSDFIYKVDDPTSPLAVLKIRADIAYNDTSYGDMRRVNLIPVDTWFSITYLPGV